MTSTMPADGAPLRHLRVLDFSGFLAGPFCTQILADLGAEVIKVEPPSGDSSRQIPPHFIDADSLYYLSVNRNKQSVAIDLKDPRGRSLALQLMARVDVVVENFGPGVRERLGIDPEALCAEHPALVWCTISGFGRQGERTDLPAYDMVVQALTGTMSITGEPGGSPVRLGIPAGDLVAGLYSCIGILARLSSRDETSPRVLDIAMFDSLLSMLSYLGAYSLHTGESPGPQGSAHESIPTYRSFRAKDGAMFVITANTERMWRDLCRVLDRPELADDHRFASGRQRLANQSELLPILDEAFLGLPAAEWVERCRIGKVPAALVTSMRDALDDARADSRSMVVELESTTGRSVEVIGNPVKYRPSSPPAATYPPRLGAHTSEVLRNVLGLTAQEVEALHDGGAIRVEGTTA